MAVADMAPGPPDERPDQEGSAGSGLLHVLPERRRKSRQAQPHARMRRNAMGRAVEFRRSYRTRGNLFMGPAPAMGTHLLYAAMAFLPRSNLHVAWAFCPSLLRGCYGSVRPGASRLRAYCRSPGKGGNQDSRLMVQSS